MSARDGLSRREFLETVAIGAPAALAAGRHAEVFAQPQAKAVLQAGDFKYQGCFKLPPHPYFPDTAIFNKEPNSRLTYTHNNVHQAPLATRVVRGERRFFVVGHNYGGGPVTEVILPGTLSPTIDGAPVAQTADYWGTSVYGSPLKRISAGYPKGNPYSILVHGLYWDEARQLLWWTFGDVFDNFGEGPTLGYAKLTNPSGKSSSPASAEAYGPFDLSSKKNFTHNVKGYILELPASFQRYVGNRRFAVGGVFDSILGAQQFGPNLIAFDEPQDNSVPTAIGTYPFTPSNRFIANTVDILRYGSGVPGRKDSHGNFDYSTRVRRPPDYSVMDLGPKDTPPKGGAGGTTVNPQNGVGWWTNQDVVSGGVWIETANKAGIVFTGGMASGRLWYSIDGTVNGVKVPRDPRGGGRTGAEFFNPGFYIFSPRDLVEGATRGYGHYQQDPLAWRHPVKDPIGKVAYAAPVYDSASRRLYVLQVNAYAWGPESVGVIHCWEIADA